MVRAQNELWHDCRMPKHRSFAALAITTLFALTAGAVVSATTAACSKANDVADEDEPAADGGTTPRNEGGGSSVITAPSGLDPACVTAQASTELRPAYVMFVVDGSNSMALEGDPPTPSQKWPALKGALEAIFDDMAKKADPAIAAGMIVFADKLDPTGAGGVYGPYPTKVDIPIGFVDVAQAGKLKGRLAGGPAGLTPTQPALEGGYTVLRGYSPAKPIVAGGAKFVVLITDGFPFSSIDTDTQVKTSLKMAADELVRPGPQGPIKTFVVGVGEMPGDLVEYNPPFLGDLSVAGGTRATPTCDPKENTNATNTCYFQITPGAKTATQLQQDFGVALDKVRRGALSCEFIIGAPSDGKAIDPTKLNVVYTPVGGQGALVPKSDSAGWRYDNDASPTKVVLAGAVCDDFQNARGKVDVFLGCASVIK